MVVALTALCRESQIHPAKCLHAVRRIDGQIFFVDRPTLVGRDVASLETGRDQLIVCRIGKQIARRSEELGTRFLH